jgi:polyferredoxin
VTAPTSPSCRAVDRPSPGAAARQAANAPAPASVVELVVVGEKPRSPRWTNPHQALPRVRWGVQLAYAAFCLLVGYEFYTFYAQIITEVPVTMRRPPAVEGFLPISALVGLKRFVLTGQWDDVHPAGLTIFAAAIVGSFLARKSFCSWVCPGGTFSRLLEVAASKLLWKRRGFPRVPRWLDWPLLSLKYLLLGFFAYLIVLGMPVFALEAFIQSPYNVAADAKMLLFFFDLSTTAVLVLAALVGLSLVVKHLWCRYLCPYGALLGLASLVSPSRVVRNAATCNDCRACTRACPVEIPVHARGSVWTPECTGCMGCVAACSTPDTLTLVRRGAKGFSPWLVPALGVGALVVAYGVARLTGHWTSTVPLEVFVDVYRQAELIGH